MFNLLPRDTVFFDLFESMSDKVYDSVVELQQLVANFPNISGSLQRIRELEHAADDLAHKTLNRLDKTFITPFDREDIHALIGELDDIIDGVDALTQRFDFFHIKELNPTFSKQVNVLFQATDVLNKAVHKLRKSYKLSDLSGDLIEIHHQESLGDDNHHFALSQLFDGSNDALDVMKWKELFELIEDAIDGCEDVGNTLERIVLKNG